MAGVRGAAAREAAAAQATRVPGIAQVFLYSSIHALQPVHMRLHLHWWHAQQRRDLGLWRQQLIRQR